MSLHVNLRWHHLESGLPVWKQTVPWSSAEPRHSSDSGWSILPERSCIWILRENDANDALHRRGWKGRDFAIGFIHLGWNLGLRAELFCERFVRIVTTLLEPKTLCKALTLHWRESRDGAPCAQILEKFLASQAEVSCRSASWPGQLGHLGSFNWNFNILIMKNLIRVPSKTHMILAMDLIHQTFFCFVQKAAIYKSQRWSFEHCWNTGLRKSHLDGILWNSESLQVMWNTIFCHWEMLNVL